MAAAPVLRPPPRSGCPGESSTRVSAPPLQHLTLPTLPALAIGQIHHTRFRPKRYAFAHRHYQWLVDLDSPEHGLPRWLRPVSRISPTDHLGGHSSLAELRHEVIRRVSSEFPQAPPIEQVVLLAHARVLGHAFDPMSAFWCLDGDGRLVAILVEVHNTYGGRHAYVVRPDARGQSHVDKEFYVSPFNDVEGEYAVSTHLDRERVAVGIRLSVDGSPVITASVTGELVPATRRTVLRTVLSQPLMTQRVSALIRLHGIRLWAKRLPIRARSNDTARGAA